MWAMSVPQDSRRQALLLVASASLAAQWREKALLFRQAKQMSGPEGSVRVPSWILLTVICVQKTDVRIEFAANLETGLHLFSRHRN